MEVSGSGIYKFVVLELEGLRRFRTWAAQKHSRVNASVPREVLRLGSWGLRHTSSGLGFRV